MSGEPLLRLLLPLAVTLPRKRKADCKFILNLNNYRNSHFQILNQAKQLYSGVVLASLVDAGVGPSFRLSGHLFFRFALFPATARRTDVSNPCSVIDKFTCDALSHYGVIEDDNYEVIRRVTYDFGGVDREHPRCELEIWPS